MFGFGKRKKEKQTVDEELNETLSQEASDRGQLSGEAAEVDVDEKALKEKPIKAQDQNKEQAPAQVNPAMPNEPEVEQSTASEAGKEKKSGFFSRIQKGLGKTRSGFSESLGKLLLGEKIIDDELLEEIETQLVTADVGMEATRKIITNLSQQISRRALTNSKALYKSLQKELQALLEPREQPLVIPGSDEPFVIMVVGVNGVGKTTTIGKITHALKAQGKSVMLAAGDTFRAAAVEQLQVWGERNDVPVIAQGSGSDSASVIFDALQAAKARHIDVLIADTAGRLHNKAGLMDELTKVKRVLGKLDQQAPHEILLVLDAGTGQNALNQAEQFNQAVGLTGLAITKLDGTAKGGIIFALASKMDIPIRYIGVGEKTEDLRPFNARQFVNALFDEQ
ncbi:MAG TPA: signal recognition particle-docking protein FtsY [Pseudomonadales bacterium]